MIETSKLKKVLEIDTTKLMAFFTMLMVLFKILKLVLLLKTNPALLTSSIRVNTMISIMLQECSEQIMIFCEENLKFLVQKTQILIFK